LSGESDGFFSGGDFVYLNQNSWSTWLWLRHWWDWVRISPQCGTMVTFENSVDNPLVHSMAPIWSTPAGLAFTHTGHYTLNMFFTNVDDHDAAGQFANSSRARQPNVRDHGNWPWHRCLARHSSGHNAGAEICGADALDDDPLKAEREETDVLMPLPGSLRSKRGNPEANVASLEEDQHKQPLSKTVYVEANFQREHMHEHSAPNSGSGAVSGSDYHAGTRSFDDNGMQTRVRQPVNVPGGRKVGAPVVMKEAAEYIKEHRDSAMSILRRLAPRLKVSQSVLHAQADSKGEVLLRAFALQANLEAMREILRTAKVVGADTADRLFGVAILLINTARGGLATLGGDMREL